MTWRVILRDGCSNAAQKQWHYGRNFFSSLIIHQVKTKLKQRKSQPRNISGVNNLDFDDFTSPFTLWYLFAAIEQIYQTLETKFYRLSKHLEFRQKYSALRRFSVFGNPNETLSVSSV